MSDTAYGDLGGGMFPVQGNPDEHAPGPPCADGDCGAPSTFGPYCAKHYCLSFSVGRPVS